MNKEYHITDFPDNVYMKLNNDFSEKFFKDCADKCGSVIGLSRKINYNRGGLYQIFKYSKLKRRIPNWLLIKMFHLIEDKYSIEDIEKNIDGMGVYRWTVIKNPKLPLEETPEIFNIIGHLMCDGCVSTATAYFNNKVCLIKMFKEKLSNIFGDIKVNTVKRPIGYAVYISHVVDRLLGHIYSINWRSEEVPKILHKLPKKYTFAFLRAVIDDEGTFCGRWSIRCSMKNEKFIRELKKLIEEKIPEMRGELTITKMHQKTKYGKVTMTNLWIKTRGVKFYERVIGFDDETQKKYLGMFKPNGVWYRKDIEFLKKNYKGMTAEEISLKIGRTKRAIYSKSCLLGISKMN